MAKVINLFSILNFNKYYFYDNYYNVIMKKYPIKIGNHVII